MSMHFSWVPNPEIDKTMKHTQIDLTLQVVQKAFPSFVEISNVTPASFPPPPSWTARGKYKSTKPRLLPRNRNLTPLTEYSHDM